MLSSSRRPVLLMFLIGIMTIFALSSSSSSSSPSISCSIITSVTATSHLQGSLQPADLNPANNNLLTINSNSKSHTNSHANSHTHSLQKKDNKVSLTLYIEAYCAACKHMLTNILPSAYKRIGPIVDLSVVAFGNGAESGGELTCQHGPRECDANMLISCVQHSYPTDTWLPFLICIESQSDPLHAATDCMERSKIDVKSIQQCRSGAEGKSLLLQAARQTIDLSPPTEYVPWVTINGKPFKSYDMVAGVCAQYEGENKEKYCSGI